MATADQILSLIRSHLKNDDAQFRKIVLQISAVEAKNGHTVISRTLRDLLTQQPSTLKTFSLSPRYKDVEDLLLPIDTSYSLSDLVVTPDVMEKIQRVVKEYAMRDELHKYGLANRRKLMLYGEPGTGKTMTAGVLAHELNLPFYMVRTEKVVNKFLGETGLKLSQVFDFIREVPALYLFDEFDTFGAQRGMENEVGEQRRILNTFLQLLDRDASDSFIVTATNNIEVIDKAMFRRFDDVIQYTLPDQPQRLTLLKEYLYTARSLDFVQIDSLFKGMSHADIKMVCSDIFKESLINNRPIDEALVKEVVSLHHDFYRKIG
jgi:SpoVK/Ycf46/Vps4 family AAA+-type ATPase